MTTLDNMFFKKNRDKFSKQLKNSSIVFFFSTDKIIKGDDEDVQIHDSNLFYLTGMTQKNTKLIIFKDQDDKIQTYLFIQMCDEKQKLWNGDLKDKKQTSKISKIPQKNIIYEDEKNDFEKFVSNLIKKSKNIYFYEENQEFTKSISEYMQFQNKIQTKFPKKKYLNSKDILKNLREIKTNEEIKQIQKAINITKDALDDVLRNLKKLKYEKEIEAILSYNYIKKFSNHAFLPIVASLENACILHYKDNLKKFEKNSLVLIDTGCEINNYKSDISRTYPITGKFTRRQKEVYQACLDIQKYAISQIKIGIMPRDYEILVLKYVVKKLIELKLITQKEFDSDKQVFRKFYPHSTGHFLGLDGHDIGNYLEPFKENQVITVEPGIYIKEEKIGIRIEDDILITKKGAKILSKNIPKEVKEIELLMKE